MECPVCTAPVESCEPDGTFDQFAINGFREEAVELLPCGHSAILRSRIESHGHLYDAELLAR